MYRKNIQRICVLILALILSLALFVNPAFAEGQVETILAEVTEPEIKDASEQTCTWDEGEPLVLHIKADEGFRMPAVFTLRINETEYSVSTDGGENPEGISYNAETGDLSIAPWIVNDGDSLALIGAAVGVSVDLTGLDNITVKESTANDFSAAQPITLTLVPAEGYKLPAELKLMLGETEYTVYTDGSAETPEGISFDAEKSELKIDASLLEIGLTVSITAKGEALAEEPDETEKPEETSEPEPSEKPEASASPTPTAEPAGEERADDMPEAAESASPAPAVSAAPEETPSEEASPEEKTEENI